MWVSHRLRTVAEELAARGHNITFASCDAEKSQYNIHFIHMEKVYETVEASSDTTFDIFNIGFTNVILQYFDTPELTIAVCEGLTKSNGWNQLNSYPNDFKFDLLIHDYMTGGCLLSFGKKFNNPPLVSMTAFRDNSIFHRRTKTATIPARNTLPYFHRQVPVSFGERVVNFVMHMCESLIWNYYTFPKLAKIIHETNSFNYLVSAADDEPDPAIYLTNYEPVVDEAQQLPPNVIGVGGLQIKKPSPLPDELREVADSASNGLILFSLGTNANSDELGESIVQNILEAFTIFPEYTFFWKMDLEGDDIRMPDNVVIRNWFPQNDVLAHKNTKLFITHGGLMSTQEAIWHGVPMLGIPMFFDQYSNIHKAVDKGIAEVLYVSDISIENLCEKILLMTMNPKYKEKIRIYSNAFRDQKETPLERAVWWIEWTMRHPVQTVLQGYGRDLNFFQIESMDVIGFVTIVIGLLICGIMMLVIKCIRCVLTRTGIIRSGKINKR
ncbi:hypothetical protein HA402_013081 [Bradysia odoriphaga]|nr:hypothetical protein HA402_013081 [Bradysia odoriphaga]